MCSQNFEIAFQRGVFKGQWCLQPRLVRKIKRLAPEKLKHSKSPPMVIFEQEPFMTNYSTVHLHSTTRLQFDCSKMWLSGFIYRRKFRSLMTLNRWVVPSYYPEACARHCLHILYEIWNSCLSLETKSLVWNLTLHFSLPLWYIEQHWMQIS